jgi:regulator of replication initiation timing
MIKQIKFLVPLLFLVACKESNNRLDESRETELKNYFVEQYKMIDAASRVDSFVVLEVDTVTQQSMYATMAFDFMGEWQKQNQLLELENELLQKRIGLMQLTREQPEAENSRQAAKQSLDTISAIENRIAAAQKKMNYYDSLSKNAVSIKPVGYDAICLYRIQKKDWTEHIDTAHITMDKNKNIVSREDFFKE